MMDHRLAMMGRRTAEGKRWYHLQNRTWDGDTMLSITEVI
jgi:hypothetical protein